MKTKNKFIALIFLFVNAILFAQNSPTAKVVGVILDEFNNPLEGVNVSYQSKSSITDNFGFYSITVPANQKIILVFTHVSLQKSTLTIPALKPEERFEFNTILKSGDNVLGDVVIVNNKRRIQGITSIEPEIVRNILGPMPGVENILKLLPGVNSNTDLGSEYSVRGGSYDENLVYVNDVEIYRPFLVRSGQQEGLSFTNSDLIQKIDFSAGGFQAKYGDKMSSVLDITYRTPKKFGASLDASLLGGSVSAEDVSKNKKWNYITGVRYRNNSLLVKSQETQTNYHPSFADIQLGINFNPSKKWQFGFLGNLSQNNYNYQPLTRQTNFGTLSNPIALVVYYDGQEKDKYRTYFGAFKSTYNANETSTYKFITSAYHTLEQEHYDIDASYYLGEVDSNIGSENFGNVTYDRAIGSQLNHARNDLDALIISGEIKGNHNIKKKFQIDWGLKYANESIRDRMKEYEIIDSAGFSINPPIVNLPHNDQPYNPYVGPIVPYQNVSAMNYVNIFRISQYLQFTTRTNLGDNILTINAGVRSQNWMVTGNSVANPTSQIAISPRFQFSLKPAWEKDILFRLATGIYAQPPSYREMRDMQGVIQPNVKAQKSAQILAGIDYNFQMWNRKFKLVTEGYYKNMTDVNTYTLDNVRIRYRANNNATAYAYGFDCRLNGEFVPGTESWFSFGYLKTEENQDNRGYIARPTDQRLKFGILFQDYMPNIPNIKLYLNLVYNTGLPGGSPSYADPYIYQSRLRDYRRADVGFSYVFTEKNNERPQGHWLKKFRDLSLGLEIYNIFNNQNAITNTWVRDAYSKLEFGIPNYMTTRVFNIKLTAKL